MIVGDRPGNFIPVYVDGQCIAGTKGAMTTLSLFHCVKE
jgi:hypothetical protein